MLFEEVRQRLSLSLVCDSILSVFWNLLLTKLVAKDKNSSEMQLELISMTIILFWGSKTKTLPLIGPWPESAGFMKLFANHEIHRAAEADKSLGHPHQQLFAHHHPGRTKTFDKDKTISKSVAKAAGILDFFLFRCIKHLQLNIWVAHKTKANLQWWVFAIQFFWAVSCNQSFNLRGSSSWASVECTLNVLFGG